MFPKLINISDIQNSIRIRLYEKNSTILNTCLLLAFIVAGGIFLIINYRDKTSRVSIIDRLHSIRDQSNRIKINEPINKIYPNSNAIARRNNNSKTGERNI